MKFYVKRHNRINSLNRDFYPKVLKPAGRIPFLIDSESSRRMMVLRHSGKGRSYETGLTETPILFHQCYAGVGVSGVFQPTAEKGVRTD